MLNYKLKAVRLVRGGKAIPFTAKYQQLLRIYRAISCHVHRQIFTIPALKQMGVRQDIDTSGGRNF